MALFSCSGEFAANVPDGDKSSTPYPYHFNKLLGARHTPHHYKRECKRGTLWRNLLRVVSGSLMDSGMSAKFLLPICFPSPWIFLHAFITQWLHLFCQWPDWGTFASNKCVRVCGVDEIKIVHAAPYIAVILNPWPAIPWHHDVSTILS